MYQTVKDGIVGILKGLGYQESNEAWNMENASENEYGNCFILKALSGEVTGNSEQQADRFYDKQTWEVVIAFEQSSQNASINMDAAQVAKDTILAKMDDPASWISFAHMMKYQSWKMEETPTYFSLTITLNVVDVYTY